MLKYDSTAIISACIKTGFLLAVVSISPLLTSPGQIWSDQYGGLERRDVQTVSTNQIAGPNCTPSAIEQYPDDVFTPEQRSHGAIIVHILIASYMFLALAIVCQEFFVPSLEAICDVLHMSEDVAGATFMAAGSSAPELATAVIAVFISKDDIGLGTVVGSAVYNVTFVIGICALFAGMVVHLNWWPLMRDCVFYAISIVALICVIVDNRVTWIESLVLVLLYVVYILLMYFNSTLEAWAITHICVTTNQSSRRSNDYANYTGIREDNGATKLQELETHTDNKNKLSRPRNDRQENNNANLKDIPEEGDMMNDLGDVIIDHESDDVDDTAAMLSSGQNINTTVELSETSIFSFPKSLPRRVLWLVSLPVTCILTISIPDCRRQRCHRWFAVTFVMSLVWLSVFSYLAVWMITVIGQTFSIPDSIMGLTFIAFGVSLPDAISSYLVVREGHGDMAISNAVGSNVFDILVCLGIPWFLQTAVITPGDVVLVYSKGLTYSSITLLSTVVFLVVATHVNGWKLDRRFGVIMMLCYVIIGTLAALYELNVFGIFHLPQCDSQF